MKTLNIFLVFFFALSTFSIQAQTKTETVKVWGNCGMCKSTIEKAAKSAGATAAAWDMESHILSVSYASSKTSLNAIENKIAAAGYDTKNVLASNKAYDNLHGCCKYERKALTSSDVTVCCKENAKCTTDNCCNPTAAKGDCCKATDAGAACCNSGKSCCAKS